MYKEQERVVSLHGQEMTKGLWQLMRGGKARGGQPNVRTRRHIQWRAICVFSRGMREGLQVGGGGPSEGK